ncbi:hypothetical protein [Gynuella sp.]|uniref:hypothetical protein n=1 Tax=Gynuella sp. TaxID=2969146 RepID=UPI003D1168EF
MMTKLSLMLAVLTTPSMAYAALPFKQSSSEWLWQGLYSLLLALICVTVLWFISCWIKRLSNRHDQPGLPWQTSQHRIEILSARKISTRSRMILVEVDGSRYIVVESPQSVVVQPHNSQPNEAQPTHLSTSEDEAGQ